MTTRNMCCLDAYVMELFEMQAFERNLLKLRDLKSSYCLTLDMELLLIFNNGWYNLRLFKWELVHLIETLVNRMTLKKREKTPCLYVYVIQICSQPQKEMLVSYYHISKGRFLR